MLPREIDLYTSNSSPLFESQTLMFCHNCVSRNKMFVKLSPSSCLFHESDVDRSLKYVIKNTKRFPKYALNLDCGSLFLSSFAFL